MCIRDRISTLMNGKIRGKENCSCGRMGTSVHWAGQDKWWVKFPIFHIAAGNFNRWFHESESSSGNEYRNIFKKCNRLQFFFKILFPSFAYMAQDREITIYDIAKHLNISATTVSRGLKNHPAINKHTRKKIAEAARLLGYRSNLFASSLRSKKTNTIGVMIPRINSCLLYTSQ